MRCRILGSALKWFAEFVPGAAPETSGTGGQPRPVDLLVLSVNEMFACLSTEERAGSPGERERLAHAREESVRTIDGQALVLLASIAGNLRAQDALTEPREYSFAPMVLARASLEAAGTIGFLLEPDLPTEERVSRSLSLRFSTIDEQRKLSESAGHADMAERCRVRLEEIAAMAATFDPPIATTRVNGRIVGIGTRPPQKELRVKSITGDPTIYRVLSGVAHGDFNTLKEFGFEPEDLAASGGVYMQPVVRHEAQWDLVRVVAVAYARAAWLVLSRAGVPRDRVVTAYKVAFDCLHILEDPKIRFWREQ